MVTGQKSTPTPRVRNEISSEVSRGCSWTWMGRRGKLGPSGALPVVRTDSTVVEVARGGDSRNTYVNIEIF